MYSMVGMGLMHHRKGEGSTDMVVMSIGTSRDSFVDGVFVLPNGDSTCSTTSVAGIPLK